MDFGKSLTNWRNPNLKARAPRFRKRKVTGTGSFRAASGTAQIKYNGKRQVQLPGLGSVKLDCSLPKGVYHEVHIKRENGRWYICLKRWKAPEPVPQPDLRIAGAVDTGINPHATDSDGQTYENPKAYYRMKAKLIRWQRAQARRTNGSRGWWEAQRRIDKCHRRINGLRKNAVHQMTNTLTKKYSHLVAEDLNVSGMMQGPHTRRPGRRRHGRDRPPDCLQGPVAPHQPDQGGKDLSQQQDLQRMPVQERETQAREILDMPQMRRKPRA